MRTATWGERSRSFAMLLGFIGFLILLNAIFSPILRYFWIQEEVGEVLTRALVYFLFLALTVLTIFSAVIALSSRFFTAPDAEMFLSRPLDERTYFIFRYWQGALATSWMLLPFWAPLLFALRRAAAASWGFVLWSILAPIPLGWIACSAAAAIVMTAARRFSAKRLKGGFGAATAMMAVTLIFLLRMIQPEKLTRPDSAVTLEQFLKTWSPSSRLYDPIALATDSVMLWLHDPLAAIFRSFILWTFAFAFYLVLVRRAAPGFLKAWLASRELMGSASRLGKAQSRLWAGGGGVWRLLWVKDLSSVLRNPVLRLQLILVVALSGIFLYSLNRLPFQDDPGLRGMLFLPACGFSQLILISVATRFIFPIESVEASGAWILRSAPLRRRDWLMSRLWTYAPPLLLLNIILIFSCIHAFQPEARQYGFALLLMILSPLGITAMTAYLGLAWQQRDVSQPEEMTTSPAGILVMACSISYVMAQIFLFYLPLHELHRYDMEMTVPLNPLIFIASAVILLGIHAIAVLLPMRMAWRRMEEAG